MILKGSTIANVKHARAFARHLFKAENEQVIVRYSYGSGTNQAELEADLVDLHLMTQVTRGKTGIFHVAINPREREHLTDQQWDQCMSMIEEEFSLADQPRIEVYHDKEGRKHLHVFWSLVDAEHEKLLQIGRFKRRLQRQADRMEERFGHARTRRTPDANTLEITDADRMRKARGGSDPKVRKKLIRSIWQESPSADHFLQSLKLYGFRVAQGERCRYVLVDNRGEVYNLVRELPKLVRLPQVQDFLQGHTLPSLAELPKHVGQKAKRLDQQVQRIRKRHARRSSRTLKKR